MTLIAVWLYITGAAMSAMVLHDDAPCVPRWYALAWPVVIPVALAWWAVDKVRGRVVTDTRSFLAARRDRW